MATTYHLPPHVFCCLVGRSCIFLDLKCDKYFSVPRGAMVDLGPWIESWGHPPSGKPPADAQLSKSASELAQELLVAGALSESATDVREVARVIPAPDCDLTSMASPDSGQDWIPFGFAPVAVALLHAEWKLRTMPIARIVEAVRKRKFSRSRIDPVDCKMAARLAMVFLRYRPFFPRNFRCLFDSLALIDFLSRFHLYPDWVFGVQDDPFSAHCWVQTGARVLNDYWDRVSGYTPIMIV